jgi:quercetin dioxygenase-like cupin family protein
MKIARIMAVALFIVASGLALHAGRMQQPGFRRTELQRHDLSAPGREVVQVRVEFDPGVATPKHTHPGEEIIYVTDGTIEYQIEGQARVRADDSARRNPVTVKAGEVFFVPAETVHMAKNTGTVNAAEISTYVVEKGKPLVAVVK